MVHNMTISKLVDKYKFTMKGRPFEGIFRFESHMLPGAIFYVDELNAAVVINGKIFMFRKYDLENQDAESIIQDIKTADMATTDYQQPINLN